MSDKKKISVVVLGNGDSLKKALITNIIGKDLSKLSRRNVLSNTAIYENDTYVFIFTPDLDASCEDIKNLFEINRYPDMALLVVENGLNGEEVLKQLEKLKETTGKPTEEFRVVLPLSYKPPYNFYTTEQVFSELSKLTADRNLMPANKRHADNPELYVSTPNTAVEKTGNANDITEGKKSLKTGKSSGTEVTLVLLGMAGTGKSASGNTILGKKQFRSRASSNPTTTECQVAETEIDGTRVRVIDTPDIFDDEIESSVKDEHVKKCKELCQSGPCVYLLVMQISRFSDSERNILKKLETAFGNNVQEQTVILFTRVDDLQRAKMSLQTFSRSCQTDLREIIKKCGNRCVVFENSGSDSGQVKKLMQTVDKMLEEQKQSYKCAAV